MYSLKNQEKLKNVDKYPNSTENIVYNVTRNVTGTIPKIQVFRRITTKLKFLCRQGNDLNDHFQMMLFNVLVQRNFYYALWHLLIKTYKKNLKQIYHIFPRAKIQYSHRRNEKCRRTIN